MRLLYHVQRLRFTRRRLRVHVCLFSERADVLANIFLFPNLFSFFFFFLVQVPVEIVESLFAMHSMLERRYGRENFVSRGRRDGDNKKEEEEEEEEEELLGWEQFVQAVEYTRLKVKKKKTKKPMNTSARQQQQEQQQQQQQQQMNSSAGSGSTTSQTSRDREEEQRSGCLFHVNHGLRMIIRHRFYELSMDGLILLNTFLMLLRLSPYAITKSTSITVGHWMSVLLFLFLFGESFVLLTVSLSLSLSLSLSYSSLTLILLSSFLFF